MNAYKLTLTDGSHHTKDVLVVATDYGHAEQQAVNALKQWGYQHWYVQSAERVADSNRYSGKNTTLILPTS